jgi:DNA adenine methylase
MRSRIHGVLEVTHVHMYNHIDIWCFKYKINLVKVKMKPFLKWVGGKQKFVDEIIEMFPENIKTYHEPFLGGGSVLLALLSSDIECEKYRANDINKHLIQTYIDVRDNVDSVIEELHKLKNDKELFYIYRTRFNKFKQEGVFNAETSALFICLNKTCFRGLYREGPNGLNAPYGHYKNPSFFDEDALNNISKLIQHVEFTSVSYEAFLANVDSRDFVYLDPPYAPETKISFTKYNASDFLNHDEFFEFTKKLPRFLMSNSAVDSVTNAFPDDKIKIITCRRSINSKHPGSTTKEVLIQRLACLE